MNNQKKINEDSGVNIDEGMQLLQDVVKSNKEQILLTKDLIASNQALEQDLIAFKYSISEFHKMVLEQFDTIEQEQSNREAFLTSIPTTVALEWDSKSRESLGDFNASIASFRKLDFIKLGALLLCFLVILVSGFFSLRFYEKSVLSKSEIRNEIIAEIYKKGEGIYDVSSYEKLKSNTVIINKWIERNPKDSEMFLKFKNGYEAVD